MISSYTRQLVERPEYIRLCKKLLKVLTNSKNGRIAIIINWKVSRKTG